MLHHKRLEAVPDKPNTKWHSIKDRFRSMFTKQHIDLVEKWYNTIAPRRHRDSFREIIKDVYGSGDEKTMEPLVAHKAENMIRLYGTVLSAEGRKKAHSWVATADNASLEKFRDIFAAIQTLIQPASSLKEAFVGRELPDVVPKSHNRKKIDWSSSKTGDQIRHTTDNPMDTHANLDMASTTTPKERFRKPLKQFDSDSIMKSLGITEEGLEKLRDQRKAGGQTSNMTVDNSGCTIYRTQQATKAAMQSNTKSRVVATFSADTASGWRTTTSEHIKNFGPLHVDRILPDQHPAIARVTASLGMCIPKKGIAK